MRLTSIFGAFGLAVFGLARVVLMKEDSKVAGSFLPYSALA